ncbi:unnamed protein product [Effrenium voratum]|uniref:Uncharacterized protein n=1 Tax=Effrenium voratum TaxID=2562239 RepID=A0AA36J3U4_9DINO|nr:unnamed protein product [Effrenium voratum]CAJ1451346.1 unnamed protein product [Effrenium voratum]
MLGYASYDSDEEAGPTAEASEPSEKRARTDAAANPVRAEPSKRLPFQKLREIKREISSARSATAVVQVVRQNLATGWDLTWGAEALYQVAKRSTARTRQEWAEDKAVLKLADKLKEEAESDKGDLDTILLSMEALRRMTLQDPAEQKAHLEKLISGMVANSWRNPVKSLARLYWLGAPLAKEGLENLDTNALASQIRQRQNELDGPDLALLLAAMKGPKGLKDDKLQSKVVLRLKDKQIHKGLSATDLVEMAEALEELAVTDEAALRPLGQEAVRRKGELTPDESHRAHTAFQAMKLPLSKVWDLHGSTKTMQNDRGKVTTQAFALQEGHEKKRGNNDIERTSPPRVVRDMKMCSY